MILITILEPLSAPVLQRRILQFIFEHGHATRQELVEALGCTLMTVSKAVAALLNADLLVVDGTLSSTGGRRKSLLKINSRYRVCIAVDIGYGGVNLALARMDGEIEKQLFLPPKANTVASGLPLHEMRRAIDALIEAAGRERVLGIGVGISGMVNFEEGRVLFCPNIRGFDDRPLAQELSEQFNLPVLLDTSARCMAMGEFLFGAGRGVKEQLFVSLGTGSIAAGILSGGRLYRGPAGFAGELGHTCVRPGRRLARCTCGGYDCLELYASLQMLMKNTAAALDSFEGYSPAKRYLAGAPLTMECFREVVCTHDQVVEEQFDQAMDDIAAVLLNSVNLLTPALVVLGGALPLLFPEAVEKIERRVWMNCLPPLRSSLKITGSVLGYDAALRGAAAMVITRFFGVSD